MYLARSGPDIHIHTFISLHFRTMYQCHRASVKPNLTDNQTFVRQCYRRLTFHFFLLQKFFLNASDRKSAKSLFLKFLLPRSVFHAIKLL